jgi:hypothetical protein
MVHTKASNSVTEEPAGLKEFYGKGIKRDRSKMFYSKTSKVIKNPEREARRLRAQMSKECYPFITVNQLSNQREQARRDGDTDRASAIEVFLAEMIRQEMEDGFPGGVDECLAYLGKNVSVGRLFAANIEAVHKQYVVDMVDDPFVHITKMRKAEQLSASMRGKGEGHMLVQKRMTEMLDYVVDQSRASGYEGTDEYLLNCIHSWDIR